jgi:hypothetical protein
VNPAAPTPYGVEYREEDWPHGLRCIDCDRLLADGDRYATRLTGFQDEIPITEVVCLECALNPQEAS